MDSKPQLKDRGFTPHLALFTVQLVFGTWPIVGKVALRSMSSTSLVALRVVGAAIAFMLLQLKLGQLRKIPRSDLAWLVLCSVIGVALNQLLFVKGLSMTTVINATLLGTTIPVFTLVVSIAFGYDRLSAAHAGNCPGRERRYLSRQSPASGLLCANKYRNLLIVTCALLYGAYIAVSKDLFKRYGALNVITWMFCIGALIILPVGAFALSGDKMQTVPRSVWLAVVYIILVPTVVCVLPKRLGVDTSIAQHGGHLYFSSAADRFRSRPVDPGRKLELTNPDRQLTNLRERRRSDKTRPQPGS